ncbi:HlyD family secretion protein [Thalassotalea ponticola]|uniref:HlyD family secretion protein n=1 Tax=Thalassotalea ponticola TaxID=1523392 RepID=UPI0025B54389|nr:HlyD family secretion protein [Thalassotalea ponticola]MDN3651322.1 HlyD family secretion protein [Thalassotalea ponticola]
MSETKTDTEQSSQNNNHIQQARSFTLILALVIILLWGYTLWADRVAPMTDQVRVNGQVIRISPEVSGPISEIHVQDNSIVNVGDSLISINPAPFELAVKAARFELQKAGQSFMADTASIDVAKANEVAARVKVNNAKKNVDRNRQLVAKGIISQATMDNAITELETAQANLEQAKSALEKAKQQSGPRGRENPAIQVGLTKLDQAILNLSNTKLIAPTNGVITNMDVAVGDFAAAGQPIMTLINIRYLWLTAMVRENSIGHLNQGDKVKIVLESYPGEIFTGKVSSIGWGSSGNGNFAVDAGNGLINSPTTGPKAQRFPVNIELIELPEHVTLRYGGRATVAFYPNESSVAETLQDLWIWAWSYISYVS